MSWFDIIKASEIKIIEKKIRELFGSSKPKYLHETNIDKPHLWEGTMVAEIDLYSPILKLGVFEMLISKTSENKYDGKLLSDSSKDISIRQISYDEILNWIQKIYDDYFSKTSFIGSFE